MRTALVIGGRPDYAGPAVRILPRTGARVYLSERWKVDDLINNNDQQQQQLTRTQEFQESRNLIFDPNFWPYDPNRDFFFFFFLT